MSAGRRGEPPLDERAKVDKSADESAAAGASDPGQNAPRRRSRQLSRSMVGIGFDFAGAFVGFVFVGFWIGRYYGSEKWGVVVGAVLGLIGGFYNLLRQALRQAPKDDEPRE